MRGGLITISGHAVKRYKQRIGKKNANRKRIIQTIRKDVIHYMKDAKNVRPSKELDAHGRPCFRYITCDRYIAVLGKNKVVTLYSKDGYEKPSAYEDFITLDVDRKQAE